MILRVLASKFGGRESSSPSSSELPMTSCSSSSSSSAGFFRLAEVFAAGTAAFEVLVFLALDDAGALEAAPAGLVGALVAVVFVAEVLAGPVFVAPSLLPVPVAFEAGVEDVGGCAPDLAAVPLVMRRSDILTIGKVVGPRISGRMLPTVRGREKEEARIGCEVKKEERTCQQIWQTVRVAECDDIANVRKNIGKL